MIWVIKNYWFLVSLLNFGDVVLFAWPQIFSIRQNIPDPKINLIKQFVAERKLRHEQHGITNCQVESGKWDRLWLSTFVQIS